MIRIHYPGSDVEYFTVVNSTAFGPFSLTGEAVSTYIESRSDLDRLDQYGIPCRHEKSVYNIQIDAEVSLFHAYTATHSDPTLDYPQRIKVDKLPTGSEYALRGWALPDSVATRQSPTQDQYAFKYIDGAIAVYDVRRNSSSGKAYYAEEVTYRFQFNGTTIVPVQLYHKTVTIASPDDQVDPGWDWSVPQRPADIAATAGLMFNIGTPVTFSTSTTANFYRALGTVPPLQYVRDWVYRVAVSMLNAHAALLPEKEEGELCLEAASQIPLTDVNVIAFLRDLKDPRSLIPKLENVSLLRDVSSVYLWQKYALLPTIDDTLSIVNSIKKYNTGPPRFRVGRAGYSKTEESAGASYSLSQRVKLVVSDQEKGYMSLLNRIDDVGMLPTLDRLWDLVPYSFAVDWLVDVGDYLKQMTARERLQRYDVRAAVVSLRREATLPLSYAVEVPSMGYIKMVLYHRRATSQCPLPSITTLNARPDLSNHILEATALIIQGRRR